MYAIYIHTTYVLYIDKYTIYLSIYVCTRTTYVHIRNIKSSTSYIYMHMTNMHI